MRFFGSLIMVMLCIFLTAIPSTVAASERIVAVSCYSFHTVALDDQGHVWEWGSNRGGELGIANVEYVDTPVRLPITNVTAVSAGMYSNLALKDDGSVWQWGSPAIAIDNNADNFTLYKVPIDNVKAICAGLNGGYAVKTDGTLWAWGDNTADASSNGVNTDPFTPVMINLTDIKYITEKDGSVFAVNSNGTVWAWGNNVYVIAGNTKICGSLGINPDKDEWASPVQLEQLTDVNSIASGGYHTLVLKNDGTVWAWGSDVDGGLGNGNKTGRLFTINGSRLPDISTSLVKSKIDNVKAISSEGGTSLALKRDGTVWQWGEIPHSGITSTPIQISELKDITGISTGPTCCMAIKSDGSLWTWGDNTFGQLGIGKEYSHKLTPVQVPMDDAPIISQYTIISGEQLTGDSDTNKTTTARPSTIASTSINNGSTTLTPTTEHRETYDRTTQPDYGLMLKIIGGIGIIVLLGCIVYLNKRK